MEMHLDRQWILADQAQMRKSTALQASDYRSCERAAATAWSIAHDSGVGLNLDQRPSADLHSLDTGDFDLIPPNVVSPGTTDIPIDFIVPEGHTELKLFDVAGRHITNLLSGIYPAGQHTFVWNGQTGSGQLVGSGVYLITLRTDEAHTYKKIIIVR